jgi:hypothetical protein
MFCEKRYSKHARWQLPVPLPSAIELWITAAFVAGTLESTDDLDLRCSLNVPVPQGSFFLWRW